MSSYFLWGAGALFLGAVVFFAFLWKTGSGRDLANSYDVRHELNGEPLEDGAEWAGLRGGRCGIFGGVVSRFGSCELRPHTDLVDHALDFGMERIRYKVEEKA